MSKATTERLAIEISIELPDSFIESYPWLIGPFPDGTDHLELFHLAETIAEALARRYPPNTEIDADVVSLTPAETVADIEHLADLIINEHRVLDPDLSNIFDDLYVREILDSIETDEVEQ